MSEERTVLDVLKDIAKADTELNNKLYELYRMFDVKKK